MRVLFVSSGNSSTGVSPIIKNQQESLIQEGLTVDLFTIVGKGIAGYLKGSILLRKHLKSNHFDIVHAHYSLSGFTATFAGCNPLVVSLMGSDTKTGLLQNLLIRIFNKLFWSACIVKSKNMLDDIRINNAFIIPNGVNFNRFYPILKTEAITKLNFNPQKKHILFAADPIRPEKNFRLTKEAISIIDNVNIDLHYLKNVPNEELVWYYCACDVIVLSSTREGSPNVIKEAMACNRPIVATDVGDVKETLGDTEGCFISDLNAASLATKLNSALKFDKQTTGRKRINYLKAEVIAKKLIKIYEQAKQ